MPGAWTTPSTTQLGPESVAALKAWADIDRFELSEVSVDLEAGWAAAGTLERERAPHPWPPEPEKAPDDKAKVLSTRIMFGCLEVQDLEGLLDRLFSDDLRFVQTGIRRPKRRGSAAPRREQRQTCRGSFRLDNSGNPVPGSFEYAPLIDFARHVENLQGESVPLEQAVSRALAAVEVREQALLDAYAEVLESGAEGTLALGKVLNRVRVHGDLTRFRTTWVGPADEPDSPLPSFFRDELLQAARLQPSPALAQYLGGRPDARPTTTQDLGDRASLEPYLDPSRIPRAAWPTGHVLRLSQQVALTAVLAEEAEPLMAVNGPPGTGKTTLLRDLYANLVTQRAELMVGFEDPVSTWGPQQELGSVNQQKWWFHSLHPTLCGFEMVLASSNNAAAENVSKELPEAGAVKGDVGQRMTYFSAAANDEPYLPSVKKELRGKRRPGLLMDGQSWGFAAVTLGSRPRVTLFEEVLGRYHGHHTVSTLLRTLAGPTPPLTDWRRAKDNFTRCRVAVDLAVNAVVTRVEEEDELNRIRSRLPAAQQRAEQSWVELQTAQADTMLARAEVTRFEGAAQATRLRVEEHARTRPGLWSRLSGRASLDAWQRERAALDDIAREVTTNYDGRAGVLQRREQHERSAQEHWRTADHAWRADLDRSAELAARGARSGAGSAGWISEDWWSRRADDSGPGSGRETVELGSAWVDARLQRLREELFEAALDVHETFVRRSHRQVSTNLRTWLALQSNEVQTQSADEVTLGAWQSLFLVVPMISTTFASVARLLRRVPYASLGWLVVDEAGQALPGAAVGALARCRRAVIVGDPLQLEPVVTLPGALVTQLHEHHRAPADLAPTRASVQTLADSVSSLGTVRLGRWISLPLVVHNRCLDPMYQIANTMAYAGKMVRGRIPAAADEPAPDPSRWIDIVRPAGGQNHFYAGDWDALDELMNTFDWEADPSLAIISPFKQVTRALAPTVRTAVKTHLLHRQVPPTGKDLDDLVSSVRVGTVHTFQGREYDTVVLVLGGATAGARSWVAATPNLLNVAVTRARDRLFVIGDRAAWSRTGHAATLHDGFPEPDESLPI